MSQSHSSFHFPSLKSQTVNNQDRPALSKHLINFNCRNSHPTEKQRAEKRNGEKKTI